MHFVLVAMRIWEIQDDDVIWAKINPITSPGLFWDWGSSFTQKKKKLNYKVKILKQGI